VKYERPVSTIFFLCVDGQRGGSTVCLVCEAAGPESCTTIGMERFAADVSQSLLRGASMKNRAWEMHNRVTGWLKWVSRDLAWWTQKHDVIRRFCSCYNRDLNTEFGMFPSERDKDFNKMEIQSYENKRMQFSVDQKYFRYFNVFFCVCKNMATISIAYL